MYSYIGLAITFILARGRAQSVCLNMSNSDVALHLHFALFDGSEGYVLKPVQMHDAPLGGDGIRDENDYWPPPREKLHCTTITFISLHNYPKVQVAAMYHSPLPVFV